MEILQGKKVRFLTLTIANPGLDLKDSLLKLDKAFSRLRRRAWWLGHVNGGVAFTEVVWSDRAKRWHPHLHVLTHGRFMPHAWLKDEWQAVTGDSSVVDIRLARTDRGVLHYVTKYVGKGLDSSFATDPGLLDEAIRALKGRRMLTTFGDFRGHALTDPGGNETWDNIGSLWEHLQLARDGDLDSLALLEQIDSDATNYVVGWLRLREPEPLLDVAGDADSQGSLTYICGRDWLS